MQRGSTGRSAIPDWEPMHPLSEARSVKSNEGDVVHSSSQAQMCGYDRLKAREVLAGAGVWRMGQKETLWF